MGYLPSSMVNYLAQLGWNDGTDKEIYSTAELIDAFKMERMSKVAAIFDKDKFKWVNGRHIKLLDDEEACRIIGKELKENGVVQEETGEFVRRAAILLRDRLSILSESAEALQGMLAFPLEETLATDEGKPWLEDNSILDTAKLLMKIEEESGEVSRVAKDPKAIKDLAKTIREARGVSGKKLMMPLRICLTGRCEGPAMSDLFDMMHYIDDDVICEYVPFSARLDQLKAELGI